MNEFSEPNVSTSKTKHSLINIKKEKSSKRVGCTVLGCNYSTPYKKDLVRHMRKHTGEKPYSCELCNKEFSRYDKLLQHTRIHEGLRPFKCEEGSCTYACIDLTSLKKHIARIHSDKKPFQCTRCSYRAKDSNQLNIHTRFHTWDSPYVCTHDGCTKAFKTSTDLQRHIRVHTREKPYGCPHCSYISAVKSNITTHVNRKHSSSKELSKTRTSSSITKNSTSKELPFILQCRFCKYKTSAIKCMKLHIRKKHNLLNFDSILDDIERSSIDLKLTKKELKMTNESETESSKNFSCSTCSATFVTAKSLKCHVKQHVMLHPPPVPTVEVVISSSPQETISTIEVAERVSVIENNVEEYHIQRTD